MEAYSWLKRSISRPKKTSLTSSSSSATHIQHKGEKESQNNDVEEDEQLYGISDELVDFVKSFTLDTFKNFTLPDERVADGGPTSSGNVRNDLSDWQERHATLVLSKVKELSQLRFRLCPGYLKEQQFWRIYFTLVKSYVAEYELYAIRQAKLKQMRMVNENSSDKNSCEVEMSEAKQVATTSLEND